jgi:hypothetical protein
MKRFVIAGVVGLSCGLVAAYAAQDTTIDNVEVRDPIRLEAFLEANASDAQSRLAVVEASLGTNTTTLVTVGALTTTGAVTISEGKLADSTVVSADIKDGAIVSADLANATAFSLGALTTTGAVTISEGKLADSTVVSADIKDGTIVSADLANATAFSLGALTITGMTTTVGFTFATKVCSLITLTNVIYGAGATTADVNIVTWTP